MRVRAIVCVRVCTDTCMCVCVCVCTYYSVLARHKLCRCIRGRTCTRFIGVHPYERAIACVLVCANMHACMCDVGFINVRAVLSAFVRASLLPDSHRGCRV